MSSVKGDSSEHGLALKSCECGNFELEDEAGGGFESKDESAPGLERES